VDRLRLVVAMLITSNLPNAHAVRALSVLSMDQLPACAAQLILSSVLTSDKYYRKSAEHLCQLLRGLLELDASLDRSWRSSSSAATFSSTSGAGRDAAVPDPSLRFPPVAAAPSPTPLFPPRPLLPR
jgi:hypothetical protein